MTSEEYEALRADISVRGVVTALDVKATGLVLDGRHRQRAAAELGQEEVPIRLVAPADETSFMLLAALTRRHLSPSQKAALAIELEEYRRARGEAGRRQLANLRSAAERATLPVPRERPRELAARIVGVSARTLQDVATVREEAPELFAEVKAGRLAAHRAAKQVRRQRQAAQLLASPPLPAGAFEVVYADPPWRSENPDSNYAPENHYPTMELEEIKALEIPAAESAVLFLWAVASQLPDALAVLAAWGFEYRTHLVWVKPSIGLGQWARHRHEPLLIGRKGGFPVPEPEARPDSVIEAPRGRHSEKPAVVYELIERAYPHATKVELFARTARKSWVAWGNEIPLAKRRLG